MFAADEEEAAAAAALEEEAAAAFDELAAAFFFFDINLASVARVKRTTERSANCKNFIGTMRR